MYHCMYVWVLLLSMYYLLTRMLSVCACDWGTKGVSDDKTGFFDEPCDLGPAGR